MRRQTMGGWWAMPELTGYQFIDLLHHLRGQLAEHGAADPKLQVQALEHLLGAIYEAQEPGVTLEEASGLQPHVRRRYLIDRRNEYIRQAHGLTDDTMGSEARIADLTSQVRRCNARTRPPPTHDDLALALWHAKRCNGKPLPESPTALRDIVNTDEEMEDELGITGLG